ncbi:TetR/AcrR family transcriptional regulator [Nocardia gamkensis]|uniref:TetR/AcrR family transcriptional regulator n=1 Tax=Nocardia gamkensis TaxID=352869 RepID=UPI0037C67899
MNEREPKATHGRAFRADSERTVNVILQAAERILSLDPHASMEQIAREAGVARTTIHRRFASREALIEALTLWAFEQFAQAVRAARPDSAPPLVALYQATANVLSVKASWSFSLNQAAPLASEAAQLRDQVREASDRLLLRARQAGILRPDIDIDWTRRVYYALICEAAQDSNHNDPDTLATRVIETLVNGAGAAPSPVNNLSSSNS